MRYSVSQPPLPTPLDARYRVMSGDEPTFIAWKVEGRISPYGVYWRDICKKVGIVDPMQVTTVGGQRDVVGQQLTLGLPLDI